jgi:hypothetical protein
MASSPISWFVFQSYLERELELLCDDELIDNLLHYPATIKPQIKFSHGIKK